MKKEIFEVRHFPVLNMLDKKGELLSLLIEKFGFKQFKNAENGILFKREDSKIVLFVDFNRFGLSVEPNSKEDFPDLVGRFLEVINEFYILYDDLKISRIGYRTIGLQKSNKNFSELVLDFKKKYFNLEEKFLNLFDEELSDVSVPLVFEKDGNKKAINFGPMNRKEAMEIFKVEKSSEIPEFSIFYDLDISTINTDSIKSEEIINFIIKFKSSAGNIEKELGLSEQK
jgi:hypothetical protein